jgi:hypothetical protein
VGTQIDRGLIQGLAVPTERISRDTLIATDAATAPSVYTQAGPGPGQATSSDADSKLSLEISGGQSVEMEFRVRRAGLPGREGLGVLARPTTDTDTWSWRGRASPNLLSSWIPAVYSATNAYSKFDLVVNPKTQALVLLYAEDTNADEIFSRAFDWSTAAWGAETDASDNGDTGAVVEIWQGVTGVALPSGRILAIGAESSQLHVYCSDDDGATWGPYSDDAGSTGFTGTYDEARAAYYRGDVICITRDVADISQRASNDLATSFVEVESTTSFGRDIRVDVLPDAGGIVVAYRRNADDRPTVRVLSSAFQPLSDADAVLVDDAAATPLSDLGMAVDELGVIWVFGRVTADADLIEVWFSTDGGASFELVDGGGGAGGVQGLHSAHGGTTYPTVLVPRFCRGFCVIAHKWTAAVNPDNGIGTIFSAGWSSVSNVARFPGLGPWVNRHGWGHPTSTVSETLLGYETPVNQGTGWANVGAVAPAIVNGEWSFTCAANNGYVQKDPFGTAGSSITMQFHHRIDAGTPALTAPGNGVTLRVADGVNDYRLQVRIGATATRLFDVWAGGGAGATLADITVDGTADVEWLVHLGPSGTVFAFFRSPLHPTWTLGYAGAATDGGVVAATNAVQIGTVTNATVTSRWRYALLNGRDLFISQFAVGMYPGYEDVIGAVIGSTPAPVIGLGSESAAGFIAATRGPGRQDETFTVTPHYDYGVENVFPVISPSPDTTFRTTDLTEVRLCFDLGYEARLGYEWQQLFGLLNINFQTAYWESSANGAAWTTRITLNAAEGFEGLTCERIGDTIRAGTGTTSGARALARNELAGGHAVVNGLVAYRILGNSPGVWVDPTGVTTKLAEIRLDADLTGAPASATVDLVWPNAVVHRRTTGDYPTMVDRYWRLRIPASQVTPDTYYQVGIHFPGDVATYGRQSSRGWSQQMRPNVQRSRSRYGTIRKREDGPPARRWTMSWTDGTLMRESRSTDPDYVRNATNNAPVLAMRDDVWLLLWGLIEEIRSGEVPVIALNSIPSSSELTITDRTLFLYGTLDGDVQFNQVVGDEGIDEFGRIDPLTVEEIR